MKLIDKDALVAEIERIDKSIGSDRFLSEYEQGCNQGKEDVCDALLSFLDTLEVKGVDLEKEIQMFSMNLAMKENNGDWEKDIAVTAKHFYELGLAASNKARKGEEV